MFLSKSMLENLDYIQSKKAANGGILLDKALEISQNSQENTCAKVSFLIKL